MTRFESSVKHGLRNVPISLVAVALLALLPLANESFAATLTDFEPAGFTPGQSVDNHQTDGSLAAPPITNVNHSPQAWYVPRARTATPAPDEEIVDLASSLNLLDQAQALAHGKVWRLSQGNEIGSLGGAPQSPHMSSVAGETGALNDASRGPVTTNVFHGQFDFRSATGAAQPDLAISVTGASFDQRHAYVSILDDGVNGFDLTFYDTVGDGFNGTTLDLNLSYTDWHTIDIETTFNDGFASGTFGDNDAIGNDVVRIFVDNTLVHTGTSWESYYASAQDHAESIDSLEFSGSTLPGQLGGGLYFDNVLVDNSPVGVPEPTTFALAGLGLCGLATLRRRRQA